MPRLVRISPVRCQLVVLTAVFGIFAASARGQVADNERGFIGHEKLSSNEMGRLTDFKIGKDRIDGSPRETAANQLLLDKAAKYYLFELTDPSVVKTIGSNSPSAKVEELFRKLEPSNPKNYDPRKPMTSDQQRYMNQFSAKLIPPIKTVLKNKEPIARLNAARVLARLAECGQQIVTDLLVEALDDPEQIDAVKLYALKGIAGLFEFAQIAELTLDKNREAACIQALLRFLDRKSKLPPDAGKRQWDAFVFLAREAGRALALSRYPAYIDEKNKIEAITAWHLIRIMRKDGFEPELTLAERVEAAYGLCLLQPALLKNYQPTVAAQFVGWFVADFLKEYSQRKPDKPETWKVFAVKLSMGLDKLKADAAGNNTVAGIVDLAKDALKDIEIGKALTPDPQKLQTFLVQNPPQNPQLIKGMAKTEFKVPDSAAN